MQAPGEARGKCKLHDDLEPCFRAIDEADAVVLGSPVNCYNVTAIFRRFMEAARGIRVLAMGARTLPKAGKRSSTKRPCW